MSIERIQAVLQAQPARSRVDEARALGAQKGDTLRLAFERAAGEDILVADDRGFALRLAGLARHVRDFVPGDVLLLRVLATAPRLELEFLGTSGGVRTSALSPAALTPELAAMRLDQTVANRISALLPEAGALASTWFLRVRDAGRPPGGGHAPLLLPSPQGAVHESPAAPVQGAIERWAVPVFAWGSLPARLRFVRVSEEDEEPVTGRRGPSGLALRIELLLPLIGALVVQVQTREGVVRLALLAEREDVLPLLHELRPVFADALAAAGMTLAGSSVAQAPLPAAPRALTTAQAQQLAAVAAALAMGPFRALAEVVVVLLDAALAADLSPANRRC